MNPCWSSEGGNREKNETATRNKTVQERNKADKQAGTKTQKEKGPTEAGDGLGLGNNKWNGSSAERKVNGYDVVTYTYHRVLQRARNSGPPASRRRPTSGELAQRRRRFFVELHKAGAVSTTKTKENDSLHPGLLFFLSVCVCVCRGYSFKESIKSATKEEKAQVEIIIVTHSHTHTHTYTHTETHAW